VREHGKKELKLETIPTSVYNGIISLFGKYKKNFAYEFPLQCAGNKNICNTDMVLLTASIQSYIPDMEAPLNLLSFGPRIPTEDQDKYNLLDFIEYCYSKIVDAVEHIPSFPWERYYLTFKKTQESKEEFRSDVNQIFERNGIVFYLDENGQIKRHLPSGMDNLLPKELNVDSPDPRLNNLINTAIENIYKPKLENRNIALEKIWDAFERAKTFYNSENKKQSATELIKNISEKTDSFDELLDLEFKALTDIGNKYQIRHFETNKIQIEVMKQVDYLFYRMIALIDLCMHKINVSTSV
jgi:hypothetical protein